VLAWRAVATLVAGVVEVMVREMVAVVMEVVVVMLSAEVVVRRVVRVRVWVVRANH
jgi:hypothetical protein